MHAGRARALVVYSCSRPRSRRRRHNDWVARRGGGASKEAGSASKHVHHGAYLDSRIFIKPRIELAELQLAAQCRRQRRIAC